MLEQVTSQIAAVIEDTPLDDVRVAGRLRWDKRGAMFTDGVTPGEFRRFSFDFPRKIRTDWKLEDRPAVPSFQSLDLNVTVAYPLGDASANTEAVSGMALDDASLLLHHVPSSMADKFNAEPVANFGLIGCAIEHTALSETEGLLTSEFTLAVRFRRTY